jgi:cyclopropane fatty-acyl-phospholipid synthase-like methyltransferase
MNMGDPAGNSTDTAPRDGSGGSARYYKRDFWSKENLRFAQSHFRMEKAARIINALARGEGSNLLDVGCGPAALQRLLDENIHYYGIDIAIHDPAPNLMETDFTKAPIKFGDMLFDIVIALGVFEYLGTFQSQKFAETSSLLTGNGKFIVSYWNFRHRDKQVYPPFNNIQSLGEFRESLSHFFSIDKFYPVGHNWHQHEPGRRFMKMAQRHVNLNIPIISPLFAVEYFFICSPLRSK